MHSLPPSCLFFFFSSRRRHTRLQGDWSSDVCSSDLKFAVERTETALLIVSRRRVTGSGASLVVETERKAIAWVGPGPVPTRLAAARTSARVLRARRPPAALPPEWWSA